MFCIFEKPISVYASTAVRSFWYRFDLVLLSSVARLQHILLLIGDTWAIFLIRRSIGIDFIVIVRWFEVYCSLVLTPKLLSICLTNEWTRKQQLFSIISVFNIHNCCILLFFLSLSSILQFKIHIVSLFLPVCCHITAQLVSSEKFHLHHKLGI